MRKLIAAALLLLSGAGSFAPLLALPSAESECPMACCRRHGHQLCNHGDAGAGAAQIGTAGDCATDCQRGAAAFTSSIVQSAPVSTHWIGRAVLPRTAPVDRAEQRQFDRPRDPQLFQRPPPSV
jgi:hypothetical protein